MDFAPGQRVIIEGIKAQPQLNGQQAIVKQKGADDRWVVTLVGTGGEESQDELSPPC